MQDFDAKVTYPIDNPLAVERVSFINLTSISITSCFAVVVLCGMCMGADCICFLLMLNLQSIKLKFYAIKIWNNLTIKYKPVCFVNTDGVIRCFFLHDTTGLGL